MIGNSLHRTMFVHYFYANDASLTSKIRIEKYNQISINVNPATRQSQ